MSAGDVIYLDLDPAKGHEQAETRPCLVLSDEFHPTLAVVVPLTTTPPRIPTYHYELESPSPDGKRSIALCDHVRSVDVSSRSTKRHRDNGWSVSLDDLYAVRRIVGRIIGNY